MIIVLDLLFAADVLYSLLFLYQHSSKASSYSSVELTGSSRHDFIESSSCHLTNHVNTALSNPVDVASLNPVGTTLPNAAVAVLLNTEVPLNQMQ